MQKELGISGFSSNLSDRTFSVPVWNDPVGVVCGVSFTEAEFNKLNWYACYELRTGGQPTTYLKRNVETT